MAGLEFNESHGVHADCAYQARTPWLWWQALGFTALTLAIAMLVAQFASQGLVNGGFRQANWNFLLAMAASQLTAICLTWLAGGAFWRPALEPSCALFTGPGEARIFGFVPGHGHCRWAFFRLGVVGLAAAGVGRFGLL